MIFTILGCSSLYASRGRRPAFTMIELVFIIVILGILASIAVPKMAANRDDAQIVSIKTDIQIMMQAVPAMSFSQAEANTNLIANTVATNPALWTRYSGSFGIDGFNFSTALFANFYSSATPSRKDISTSCVIAWVHKKQAARG